MDPFTIAASLGAAKKMKNINDVVQEAESRHRSNEKRFEECSEATNKAMDKLGETELKILNSFEKFSDTIEKIQNRPQFKEYTIEGINLPEYDKEELTSVSVAAGVLLGGLVGAIAGTAGRYAAAGVTANVTSVALGGSTLAIGGGGVAAGKALLGFMKTGVGAAVGVAIFSVLGSKMSDNADEAWRQMKHAEETIDGICKYLKEMRQVAEKYVDSLRCVNQKYMDAFSVVNKAVNGDNKIDFNDFTPEEKLATQNTVLLVGLLFKMCQVKLVNKAENDIDMNTINRKEIDEQITNSTRVINKIEGKSVDNTFDSETENDNTEVTYSEKSEAISNLSKVDEYIEEMLKKIKGLCIEFNQSHGNKYGTRYDLEIHFEVSCYYVWLGYDATLSGNGKNGFVITNNGIYCQEFTSSKQRYSYEWLAKDFDEKRIYITADKICCNGVCLAYVSGSSDSDRVDLRNLFREIGKCASYAYSNIEKIKNAKLEEIKKQTDDANSILEEKLSDRAKESEKLDVINFIDGLGKYSDRYPLPSVFVEDDDCLLGEVYKTYKLAESKYEEVIRASHKVMLNHLKEGEEEYVGTEIAEYYCENIISMIKQVIEYVDVNKLSINVTELQVLCDKCEEVVQERIKQELASVAGNYCNYRSYLSGMRIEETEDFDETFFGGMKEATMYEPSYDSAEEAADRMTDDLQTAVTEADNALLTYINQTYITPIYEVQNKINEATANN